MYTVSHRMFGKAKRVKSRGYSMRSMSPWWICTKPNRPTRYRMYTRLTFQHEANLHVNNVVFVATHNTFRPHVHPLATRCVGIASTTRIAIQIHVRMTFVAPEMVIPTCCAVTRTIVESRNVLGEPQTSLCLWTGLWHPRQCVCSMLFGATLRV